MSSPPSTTRTPCTSCKVQNIREWVLPSSPNVQDLCRASQNWRAFVTNKHCGLCKLIVKTLFQSPDFSEAVRAGHVAEVIINSGYVGKVIWRPVARDNAGVTIADRDLRSGWCVEDGCMVKYVNEINVYAELDGRSWHGIIRASGHDAIDEKDRLLLVRSVPSDRVDVRRIKYWLRNCKGYHSSACLPTACEDLDSYGFRVIDVKRHCIVAAPPGCKYLALSYCWGDVSKKKHLKLTTANFAQLHTPGELSMDNVRVPATIRDAIYLTECLGYKYLWVDALCIVQDNKAEKEVQINLMDRLYKSATLTVVAAAGADAWSGLPGVLPDSRSNLQFTESVDGVTLVTASTDYIGAIAAAAWSKRAWVLQESNLSPRLLVFTPRQVFWECNEATWSEEVQLECFDRQIRIESDNSTFMKPRSDLSPVQKYAFLLGQYTPREMTNQYDALNAVQGLLNDLKPVFPEGFFWGLPEPIFDTALLWDFGRYEQAPKPRRAMFPSWCWAGWQAEASFSVGSPFDYNFKERNLASDDFLGRPESIKDASTVRALVAWYRVAQDKRSWKAVQNNWVGHSRSTFYAESIERWQAQDLTSLLYLTLQVLERAGTPASHALVFWAQVVLLDVDMKFHKDNSSAMAVRDRDGQDVGYINLTAKERYSRSDRLSFILVGRNLRWGEPLLDLICVEWVNGIAFRVQVMHNATITEKVWHTLDPEWRLIILA